MKKKIMYKKAAKQQYTYQNIVVYFIYALTKTSKTHIT